MGQHMLMECLDCGTKTAYSAVSDTCPRCDSAWREVRYDLEALSRTLQPLLSGRTFDLWRYRELLPVRNTNQVSSRTAKRLSG